MHLIDDMLILKGLQGLKLIFLLQELLATTMFTDLLRVGNLHETVNFYHFQS